MTAERAPELSAIVVHWRGEEHLAELVAAWPRDPRFELVVVDNSTSLGEVPAPARVVVPGRNLGFGGGVNCGLTSTSAPWVLILNPDVRPREGALERILAAIADFPDAAGIVPALEGPGGESQCRWQLQPLPSPSTLVLQTLLLGADRGPRAEPARGTAVEQPAAAALVLRRTVLDEIGGFDEGYYPAWFEDVDLARRLRQGGHRLVFEPAARFVHALGGSVPELGYGPFLWVYYRNLTRYLRLHHGTDWALAARWTLIKGMALRLLLLPLRRPRRAPSRRAAAAALIDVIRGASSDWRRPASYAEEFTPRRREGTGE
ncbi:MAG: glycosyltransferase family 2 protein [Thermoanaerobaculia bacterium]